MARKRRDRSPGPEVGGNPFTERGFLVSAGMLGICLLVGVIAVLSGSPKDRNSDADSTSVGALPTPQLPALAGCPAQPTPGADTVKESPLNASWTAFRGLAVPFSNTAGPLAAQGDVARCFAHSEAGALIAAVHISVRYAFSPSWRDIAAYQIVADPNRDAVVQQRAGAEQAAGSGSGQASLDPQRIRQVAGYQIISYTDEAATVRILSAAPSGGTMVSSMYAMAWVDGDWKIRMQPTGSIALATQQVDSVTGFTIWSESAGRP